MALSLEQQFGPARRQAQAAVGMNTKPQQLQLSANLPSDMLPQRPTRQGLSVNDQFGAARQQAEQGVAGLQRRQQAQRQAASPMRPGIFGVFGQQRMVEQNEAANRATRNAIDMDNAQRRVYETDPGRNPFAAFQRNIGTSEDFYGQQSGQDPMDAMLRQQLMARASGQNQPYDARTIGALKTGANEQAASAEMANNMRAQQLLEQRGFKPGDPGYEAAMSRNQLARQQANQAASLGINQQANVANYNAQGQALGQMGGYQTDAYNRQAGALDRLQRQYDKVSMNDMGTASRFRIPTYADMMRNK
jgi:hypothetical protein